jgi:protein-S-isoprenylcysteine O-methyltransferase Ste14
VAVGAGQGARLFAVVAYLLGIAGMAALGAYVLFSGLGHWPRDQPMSGPLPWLVNAGWLALFALQHSGMARRSFKDWLTRWVPAYLERSVYVAASGLVTLVQPWIWQPLPGGNLWQGPVWLIGISLAGAAGVAVCFLQVDHVEFLGLRQVGIGASPAQAEALRITGPYRWVRHPLMLGTLVFLWGQPMMPPELLLLDGGLTVYVLAAIHLEERELLRKFGPAYDEYRRRVPALIPWRWPAQPRHSANGG